MGRRGPVSHFSHASYSSHNSHPCHRQTTVEPRQRMASGSSPQPVQFWKTFSLAMPSPQKSEPLDRREFLRGGARLAAFTALGALVARSAGRLPGQTCVNSGICRPCPNSADCGLPQALSFRQAVALGRKSL